MPRLQNRLLLTATMSMRCWRIPIVAAMSLMFLLAGCANRASPRTGPGEPAARPQPAPSSRKIDARQAERLQRVMAPLIKNMNHPLPLNLVRVTLLDDPQINAANAGSGEFMSRSVSWRRRARTSCAASWPTKWHTMISATSRKPRLYGPA
jgi:hypothetical protein